MAANVPSFSGSFPSSSFPSLFPISPVSPVSSSPLLLSVVHAFIQKAHEVVSKDTQMSSKILSLLMDDLVKKYKHAMSTVDFLLRIEHEGTPTTLNHYFNDNLKKWSVS